MGLLARLPLCLTTILAYLVATTGVSGFLLDDAAVSCESDVPFSLSEIPVLETRRTFYMVKLNKPYLVSRLVFSVEACKAYDRNAPTNITVTYVDADDATAQTRKYSDHMTGTMDPDFISVMYDFPTTLYTENIVAVASDALDCATLRVEGCQPSAVCTSNPCKNGGTCINTNRCSCPIGYIGELCDMKAKDIVIESLEPTSLVGNKLNTKDGHQFNVSGQVALVPMLPPGLNGAPDTSGYLLFSDGDVTTGGTNQTSRKRTFGLLPGLVNVFSNFVLRGFTHTSTLHFGNHHHFNHVIHLYHTFTHPRIGAALSYSEHRFVFTVETGLKRFRFKLQWRPNHNGPYVVTSSYCPSLGLSLHVNGHLLGSLAHGKTFVSSLLNHLIPRFCFGHCNHHHNHLQNAVGNFFMSHIKGAAGCSAQLTGNGKGGMLGLPQVKVTTPPTTPPTTTTTITMKTTTTAKTTPAPFTATSQGSNSHPNSTSQLLCYSCLGMPIDGACLIPKLCKSSEVCALFKDPVGYNHRCLDATICKNAQAIGGQSCWECCSSSLCNYKCGSSSAPCKDSIKCSLLKSAGYSVCKNTSFAQKECKKSCGLCGNSG